jgi:hypothetical protein
MKTIGNILRCPHFLSFVVAHDEKNPIFFFVDSQAAFGQVVAS